MKQLMTSSKVFLVKLRLSISMNWFEVSKEGLKELQLGKPKHFVARELIQNAWDEETKNCVFDTWWSRGLCIICVSDDSPEGFKDLRDAFTLFSSTSKRKDPSKRGRFNIGEKQAFAICESATITTTKGTIIFDQSGRTQNNEKTKKGSSIEVRIKMTEDEFDEMIGMVKSYLTPRNIEFWVNGEQIHYRKPFKIITASLPTEIERNKILKRVQRQTKIHILKSRTETRRLYEMGIPITEIDCEFDIDVQQKIPLSIDRDTVPQSYLSSLFAEVLNRTFEDIDSEDSSQVWIRQATGDKRIKAEAIKEVIKKRFGEKVVVANPFDKSSIDDAISDGYKVITGNELSKEEWENVRKADAVPSSSELFGKSFVGSTPVKPTPAMLRVSELTKKIAKRCLGISVNVHFREWEGSTGAQYGDKTVTFNVRSLGIKFFQEPVSKHVLDLIIHELAHEKGRHTEKIYHETLTKIAGELIMTALEEPEFFGEVTERSESCPFCGSTDITKSSYKDEYNFSRTKFVCPNCGYEKDV